MAKTHWTDTEVTKSNQTQPWREACPGQSPHINSYNVPSGIAKGIEQKNIRKEQQRLLQSSLLQAKTAQKSKTQPSMWKEGFYSIKRRTRATLVQPLPVEDNLIPTASVKHWLHSLLHWELNLLICKTTRLLWARVKGQYIHGNSETHQQQYISIFPPGDDIKEGFLYTQSNPIKSPRTGRLRLNRNS